MTRLDDSGLATAPPVPGLRLSAQQLQTLRGWASRGYPYEVCGVLIGTSHADGTRVREIRVAPNLERSRATDRYALDPEALLAADHDAREAGLEIVGFWHSHPDCAAVPSETDRSRAWEGYVYVIVRVDGGPGDRGGTATEVRAWSLRDDAFHETEVIYDGAL